MAFRRLVAGFIAFTATVLLPHAQASATNHCGLDQTTGMFGCSVYVPGGGGGHGGPAPDNPDANQSPYRTEVEVVGACIGDIGPGDETDTPYVMYRIRIINNKTNELVDQKTVCQIPTDPPPPPPPPPPTPAQIVEGFDEIGTLRPELLPRPIGENGSKGGVVQFESWGWCEPPDNPVVEIELGPWRARAEMEITGLTWNVDGPEPFSAASPSCGTPQTPNSDGAGAPFKWTGHKKGDYTVTLTTMWTGTAQYWLNGQLMGTIDMGSYQYSAAVNQTLREIEVVNS